MIVPDTIEPVVGWKGLGVFGNGDLFSSYSVAAHSDWPHKQRFEAECVTEHDVPDIDCSCGIYVADNYRPAVSYTMPGGALVEVYGWGKIVEHELGWRVQYAYPKQIILLNGVYYNSSEHVARRIFKQEEADAMSEKYGVPVIIADYGEYAFTFSTRAALIRAGKICFGFNAFAQLLIGLLAQSRLNMIIGLTCLVLFAMLMLIPGKKKLPHERDD